MDKKFGEKMYKTIVINGMDIYKNLYENPALAHLKRQEFTELYNKLTEEEKCIYYDNIRDILIDTTSLVLGILDGICSLNGGGFFESKVIIDGEDMKNDMQDSFLAYIQENDLE